MGSVDWRALKLLAFKVGGLKKKSAIRPWPHLNRSAQVRLWLGSNHSQSLTDNIFAALWPTDPIFTVLKDLNLLKKHIKSQEADSILRISFALSKWPHLRRENLVTICSHAVDILKLKPMNTYLPVGERWLKQLKQSNIFLQIVNKNSN